MTKDGNRSTTPYSPNYIQSKEYAFSQYPMREFRAVWVAIVSNIDWPSAPGIESEAATFHFQLITTNNPNGDPLQIIARNEWSDNRGSGYDANAIRKNLSHRDTLRFQDLTIIVDQMMRSVAFPGHLLKFDPGDDEDDGYSESVTVRVQKQGVSETLYLNPGQSLNWYGFHISLLNIDFQYSLADFEVATVGSLPVNRATLLEAGNGNMRLRVRHHPSKIAITHHTIETDSIEYVSTAEYLNRLFHRGIETDNRWDLPHHYYINSKGEIYEGRNAQYAGEGVADFDPRGYLIINFLTSADQENITSDQLRSVKDLISYLSEIHGIKKEELYLLCNLDRGVREKIHLNNWSSILDQILQ